MMNKFMKSTPVITPQQYTLQHIQPAIKTGRKKIKTI